ncbi:MAG: DUF2326 domain-containing protein [Sutterella sp.]|nr:DUF2326 domain-containing protein [Sutterella sp.]
MQKLYEKKDALAKLKEKEKLIRTEFTDKVEDLSTIEGLLLLKSNEADRKQALLDAFDFRRQDLEKTDKAVNDLDASIAAANVQRYRLTKTIKQIEMSLAQGNFSFDLPSAEQVFNEMQILFAGQIKKDFEDLISFNKDISLEREKYLKIDLSNKKSELDRLNQEIDDLGIKRVKTLEFIKSSDVFEKYKMLSGEMSELRASVELLKEKQKNLKNLQDIRAQIRALTDEDKNIRIKIEENLEAQSTDKGSRLSEIRLFFNEIVETVIDQKALLTVSPANDGSLDFDVNIVDEDGKMTSAGDGHSYGRLLCVAFDLAVLRAHIKDQFPMFVFHDGVFETWDDRKKQKLLEVIRRYASMGLQPIVTAIDADLPAGMKSTFFHSDEIILRLHDRDDTGRLFKMPKW